MSRTGMVGVIGLALCVLGAFVAPIDMPRAWLAVALLALGFPLGALTILMIDNLTGGRWGEATRPLLLAMAGSLPLALLALAPLLFDLRSIFPWIADPVRLSLSAQQKLGYLNEPGLVTRFVAAALLWLGLAFTLGVWHGGRLRFGSPSVVSGLGLALHAVVFTVFATDWMLALEPEFYSTIYPMLVVSEQIVASLAAIILLAVPLLSTSGGAPGTKLGEDLGKLLIAAVFFWGYLAFMQWVIIWSGDLRDEIAWYLVRLNGGWGFVLWGIVLLAFAVPFAGLMSRRLKRDRKSLAFIVAAALIGQCVEAIWRIVPAFSPSPILLALLLPAGLAIGGLGLFAIGWLRSRIPAAAQGESRATAR